MKKDLGARNGLYFGDANTVIPKKFTPFGHPDPTSVDAKLVILDPTFTDHSYYVTPHSDPSEEMSAQEKELESRWSFSDKRTQDMANALKSMNNRVTRYLDDALEAYPKKKCAFLIHMAHLLYVIHDYILAPNGSIFVILRPKMAQHVGEIMDRIFGANCDRGMITWKTNTNRNDKKLTKFGANCYHILYFCKDPKNFLWYGAYKDMTPKQIASYNQNDGDGRGNYKWEPLHASGASGGGYRYKLTFDGQEFEDEWLFSPEGMQALLDDDRIGFPEEGDRKRPVRKVFFSDEGGKIKLTDTWDEDFEDTDPNKFWDDVPILRSSSERRPYGRTQKPEKLYRRLIEATTDEGDLVFDPCAGTGTTAFAAEDLGRRWVMIDIEPRAYHQMQKSLQERYDTPEAVSERGSHILDPTYTDCEGWPTNYEGGVELSNNPDKSLFERWVVEECEAEWVGRTKGFDGLLMFKDKDQKDQKILVEVKSNSFNRRDVGVLVAEMGRENAELGIIICVKRPRPNTKGLEDIATYCENRSVYKYTQYDGQMMVPKEWPRIQILTLREIMDANWRLPCPTTFRSISSEVHIRKNLVAEPLRYRDEENSNVLTMF